MSSAFLSYSSKDRSEARRLARELTRNGVRTWIDEYEILPGDSIVEKISEGLRESKYVVVLISHNSVESDWVRREIEAAITRNRDVSSVRIIPVKIDDAELPPALMHLKYVDLHKDYQSGLNNLLKVLSKDIQSSATGVEDIFKADDLAGHIKQQQKEFKGSGHLITTILGILTLVVSIIVAIPSFHSAFSNKPIVFYSVSDQKIVIPPDIDGLRIRKVLSENKIPEATLRIDIINMGDTSAKEVKAGVKVPGVIEYARSEPPPEPPPVWVNIAIKQPSKPSLSYSTFSFKELVPTKKVSALVGFYNSEPESQTTIDVIYDGKPAIKIDSVDNAPRWSYWALFEMPLKILGVGFMFTLLVGIIVVIQSNPKLREAALLVIKELNPTIAKSVDLILRAMR